MHNVMLKCTVDGPPLVKDSGHHYSPLLSPHHSGPKDPPHLTLGIQ